MKICFDSEIFWKEKFGSISSRYYFNLIKILSNKKDLNLKVFSRFYQNKRLDDISKKIVVGNRIKFKPPYTGKIFQKLNSFFLNREIKKFQPDIIHKTYYSNYFIKNYKSKIILTVMDLWHEKNSKIKHRPKEHSLKISDHIICPSNSTKNDLIEFYNISENKITVTYFGAEKFENIEIKKNIKFYEKPFLLFIGQRGRYKNFNNFIKAYSNSQTLCRNFNIICFGGENFSLEEVNLFKKLKVFDCVHKEKSTDDQTLFSLYKNAKCLVYPSAHEGLGLPPIEAMSHGCPVITSNHAAIVEGVGEAAAKFDPNNRLEIQNILEECLFSQNRLNNLINLGLLRAKKFSWDRCASETLEVYKKVLN